MAAFFIVIYSSLSLLAVVSRAAVLPFARPAKILPLGMLIIIISVAAIKGVWDSVDGVFWPFILAGLCCGLAGDVFLLHKSRYFRQGIIAFLLGHLLYIAAFSGAGITPFPAVRILLPLALYAVVYLSLLFKLLLPRHKKLLPIALAYALAILAMSLGALVADTNLQARSISSLFFPAALLFTVSDGILAYRIFGRYTRLADSLVLITYYCAQGLIALSLFASG